MNLSLVWLRRDLRLNDHVPLALALAESQPVQPVFIFDTEILARFADKRDRRVNFLARTLIDLHQNLKSRGGGLLVIHGAARVAIPKLAVALKAEAIFSGEDFEESTRARDAAVKRALASQTRFVQAVDHLLRAPTQILKDDGTPFKVFTPFYKRWLASLNAADSAEAVVKDAGRYADFAAIARKAEAAGLKRLDLDSGLEATLAAMSYEAVVDELWSVTGIEARLAAFTKQKLTAYPLARDVMADAGTSRLSPYLRFGLISIRACLRAAQAAGGGEKWISELAWREFYAMILYHFPHTATLEFQEQYRGSIPWNGKGAAWDAFCAGKTGFPIVDAAVRELLTTGWMHNRARMIVASFLTKDLLIDWRLGEEFFAQYLMDYEMASNVGGWQWAASTGTDAAPYFRVFNPLLQSKKFDGAGAYIRRYVPELAGLKDDEIHEPATLGLLRPSSYPTPIVDHAAAKTRVIEVFKAAGMALRPPG
ncbi:MAG: cryptochrome/photolyase family protein [Alphaproteobacteria bacterium]